MIGIRTRTLSVTARPGPVIRINFIRKKIAIGEKMIHTTPGTVCPGALPATHELAFVSQIVRPGSSTSKSLKISWNFGITKYMIAVTIATAIVITQTG